MVTNGDAVPGIRNGEKTNFNSGDNDDHDDYDDYDGDDDGDDGGSSDRG